MGIFSFGKKDEAPRRRGADAGSSRRSSQNTRVERRSRRTDRSADAEAMLLDPTLPEKQRARRRLVGAIALVLAAIVILPMVLDSHPKPVTDDIAIDIPSHPAPKGAAAPARDDDDDTQAGVAPDNPPAPGASSLAAASAPAAAPAVKAPSVQTAQSAPAQTQVQPAQQQTAQTAQAQPKPAAKPAQSAANNATNTATGSAKSAAGSDDSGAPAAPPGARFAVQLGAFSSDAAANKWVTKLKAAGVPAYTEQRKDADGTTRTLLRAGPFADRAAATEAIAKVRGAGLTAGSNANAE